MIEKIKKWWKEAMCSHQSTFVQGVFVEEIYVLRKFCANCRKEIEE